MPEPTQFTVSGPKGHPVLGMLLSVTRDPIGTLMRNALQYGDLITFPVMGRNVVQINHPALVRHVLVDNHKNYRKSRSYIRTESVIGQGLITGNGEKWKRDRQKIQPMFRRELIEGYYFDVAGEVAEKYKRRWLKLTERGPAEIDITYEMAAITLEVIAKIIFGTNKLDQETIESLHTSYAVFFAYLKKLRVFPKVDLDKVFQTPRYHRFKRELDRFDALLDRLIAEYRAGVSMDKYNMLTLLLEAQKLDPENFSDKDIRDHAATMVFAGFETNSILMQWLWHTLDLRPDVADKLRGEITSCAPSAATQDSSRMSYAEVERMEYLLASVRETMRLYPSIWMIGREPIEDDVLGGYPIARDTMILLPQVVIHRHPKWWHDPSAFIPERFLPENESKIEEGLYFPFALGARKCTGHKLAEMEAKVVFAKLLPLFNITALNSLANNLDPAISLKLEEPLRVRIERR